MRAYTAVAYCTLGYISLPKYLGLKSHYLGAPAVKPPKTRAAVVQGALGVAARCLGAATGQPFSFDWCVLFCLGALKKGGSVISDAFPCHLNCGVFYRGGS